MTLLIFLISIVISSSIGLSCDILTDRPGKAMYNGSVSSMAWSMDADAEVDYDISEGDIMSLSATTVDKTEYRGMAVYKDNKPYMLLFRGGYVTFDGGVTFHYYTPDYLGNNPVNIIDPTGKVVIGVDEQAQQNIINTLTEEEASFVEFINGKIDAYLLNKRESNTVNMNALKTVVNSKEIFYIETATSYVTKGETKQMADRDKSGSYGVTLLPGASEEPSPDNYVHIYTNIKKSSLQQVENTAHELYGHGYFYALKMQGHDVNPIHDYQNVPSIYENEMGALELIFVFSDVNAKLVDQIKSVSSQAISNYKKRYNK